MLFLGIAVLKLYTGIHHLKRQKKKSYRTEVTLLRSRAVKLWLEIKLTYKDRLSKTALFLAHFCRAGAEPAYIASFRDARHV